MPSFYLMSRGIPEEDARAMIVSGFADNVSKELPAGVCGGNEQSDPSGNERKYWIMDKMEQTLSYDSQFPVLARTGNWLSLKVFVPFCPLSNTSFHFQTDQIVHFHRIFHRKLLRNIVGKAADNQSSGIFFAHTSGH